jgi:hypothetical protein
MYFVGCSACRSLERGEKECPLEHTQEYLSYLESPEWKLKRDVFLHAARYRCAKCKTSHPAGSGLEVHHLHYDTLSDEKWKDVLVLCVRCHEAEHLNLAIKRQRDAGIRTYGRKRHGENWEDELNWSNVARQFDRWVIRKKARNRYGY